MKISKYLCSLCLSLIYRDTQVDILYVRMGNRTYEGVLV
jgi:hypothetical protein